MLIFLSFIWSYLTSHNLTYATTPAPPSPYHYKPPIDVSNGISLKSGVFKVLKVKWERARGLALLEQAVEDYNAEIVATAPDEISSLGKRMAIVLPLEDRLFNPPPGVFSHGHVQTGDKMSLTYNFWQSIMKSQAEVPWLFEVSRVPSITSPRKIDDDDHDKSPFSSILSKALVSEPNLQSVVGGAIDFRAPPNFVFLPHWMMHALHLKPLDVVLIKAKTDTSPGASVKLRPHAAAFAKIRNHQAVLETELKHYSALVKGSTIPFDYLGKRYYFDVVDLRSAPRNERVSIAKVQDCDLVAEFVRSKEDIQRMKEEKESRRNEQEDEED